MSSISWLMEMVISVDISASGEKCPLECRNGVHRKYIDTGPFPQSVSFRVAKECPT